VLAHRGESGVQIGWYRCLRMATSSDLGYVTGQITHAPDLLRHPDGTDNESEISSYRRLQCQQIRGMFIAAHSREMDQIHVGDHLLGGGKVSLQQGM
jgi:hypothetical protein